jgi:release factor glutamine methyltransferase
MDASLDAIGPETSRREAMRLLAHAFATAGIEDPAVDARLLLCAAAGFDHAGLIRDPDLSIEEASGPLLALAQRRLAREPVSRILGSRSFWSFDLLVTPAVLDPRPDTETIVDAALDLFASRQNEALSILDLGTGSGALLCALLDAFPQATGLGLDLSPEACAVARENLARCELAPRAMVRQGGWDAAPGPWDLIVSNPPYIPSGDIAGLSPEVRQFDPRLALDGGADGLDAYRAIAALLPGLLAAGGLAVLEVGIGQAAAVAMLLQQAGLGEVAMRHDLAGTERVVFGRQTRGSAGPT